jgi:hypothetical protein
MITARSIRFIAIAKFDEKYTANITNAKNIIPETSNIFLPISIKSLCW